MGERGRERESRRIGETERESGRESVRGGERGGGREREIESGRE